LLVGAAVALPRCSLLVNLDVEEVPAGPPDGCAICTPLGDGGEDGTTGSGDDATVRESGSTEAAADAPLDGNRGDGTAQDAGVSG
jgi:hypothetical protein